ncbi:PqiC family protein [Paraburkholderia sp. SARCC-3016]|uniref:PqiC family protein n=1 Tax=Paraburkholderia sp. SARCC-3016 TaxID=3058611 RepID=UPI0028094377|nr:PqiC family protein [Paraburkholderia sp. SARCC-3016]MDQ7976514.1 PqiC family protein [Paraburkholderia sp. SARCC-3016]
MTFAWLTRSLRAPRGTAARSGSGGKAAGALTAGVLCALALAACSSPSSRFYTLSTGDSSFAPNAATSAVANPAFLIEMTPVDVPPQVARNQFVVQTSNNQVDVLEQERWASLPGDEIRRALSNALTRQLGTIDVFGTPYPDRVPVYRVKVNVQRFESWPGSHALIDAVWSVRAVRTQALLTCRTVASVPVAGGYDALAVGHQRAVQQISGEIADAVRALSANPTRGATPACPSASVQATPTAAAMPKAGGGS